MAGPLRRTRPGRDQHTASQLLDLVNMQVSQMREEQMETAGFLACQGMLHNYFAAARDDQFLVEQDLHEAAAPGDGLLRNRDHHVPENSVAVGHRVTEIGPESSPDVP
jgi:hypothetical protein